MLKYATDIKILAIVLLLVILTPLFWYYLEVEPHVDNEISSLEKNIRDVNDPQMKIKEIANFTETGYTQAYGRTPTLTTISARFWFALTNNPYFIAYYKAGACLESAYLFDFFANKSGFESRLVKTKAEDHIWNEVKIDNRWVQVDPTIYYYSCTDPTTYPTYKDLWFDNPQAYNILQWREGYTNVFVVGTNEDLTAKYCNSSQLIIDCQDCNRIRVKSENSIDFSSDSEVINSTATFVLGKKNYTIIADKTIIPFLVVSEKKARVSLVNDKKINISTEPEIIQLTLFS